MGVRGLLLIAVAVLGTLWYGGSLVFAFHIQGWWRPAIWLTLWTGLAWAVFIPLLARASRVSLREAADECLITMAWGEAVLFVGGVLNFLGFTTGFAIPFNIGWVMLANVVMALVLIARMRRLGAEPPQVAAYWMLVLNGGGAVLAGLLAPLFFAL